MLSWEEFKTKECICPNDVIFRLLFGYYECLYALYTQINLGSELPIIKNIRYITREYLDFKNKELRG